MARIDSQLQKQKSEILQNFIKNQVRLLKYRENFAGIELC